MKKIYYILFVLPLIMLASCTSDEDFDKRIIGTWYVNQDKTEVVVNVKSNSSSSKEEIELKAKEEYKYKSLVFSSDKTLLILYDDMVARVKKSDAKGEYEAKDGSLAMYLENGDEKYIKYYINDGELTLIFDATTDYTSDGATFVEIKLKARKK